MTMKTALLGALALAGVLASGQAFAQAAQGEPYKIGIILPMTGSTADYGTDFKRGAELGEEEINAKGGINGRPIKLEYGDSKNSAKGRRRGIQAPCRGGEASRDHFDDDRRDHPAVPAVA